MPQKFLTLIAPLAFIYTITTGLFIAFGSVLDSYTINHTVLISANTLLFIISLIIVAMNKKAIKNSNPHVFSRSVMGGTVLKLFVLGIAAVLYLLIAGNNRSVYAIFVSMLLYIPYTIMEVKIALLLNKK